MILLASTVARDVWTSCSRWGGRSTLTVCDQVCLSGSNFLLAVLFARWMEPVAYGAFAVSFSLFLFAAGLHNALVQEPMSVVGPRVFPSGLPYYLRGVLRVHFLFAGALTVTLLTVQALLPQPALSQSLLGLSWTSPVILLCWLARRACYTLLRPGWALSGSVIYLLVMLTGLTVAWRSGWHTQAAPFVLMGSAGLAASLVMLPLLAFKPAACLQPQCHAPVRRILSAHWNYGQWAVGISLCFWIAYAAFPAVLAASGGLETAGALRAAENLMQPVIQIVTAWNILLLPWAAGQTARLGVGYLRGYASRAALAATALVSLYLVVPAVAGQRLLDLVYGKAVYSSLSGALAVLALAYLVRGISDMALATSLRAAARPQAVLAATATGALLSVSAGVPLAVRFGVPGAAVGLLLSSLAQAAVLGVGFRRLQTGRIGLAGELA